MNTHNVLCLDPGGATGWASWLDGEFQAGEILRGFPGFCEDHMMIPWERFDLITVESFTVNATTHKKDPVMFADTTSIIGAVRFIAYEVEVECKMPKPEKPTGFATDAKLKQAGLWHPTRGGHANDACRHLLIQLMNRRAPVIMERFK